MTLRSFVVPGLVAALLVGNTAAKALALTAKKPFIAINHLEGHMLSPFILHKGDNGNCKKQGEHNADKQTSAADTLRTFTLVRKDVVEVFRSSCCLGSENSNHKFCFEFFRKVSSIN